MNETRTLPVDLTAHDFDIPCLDCTDPATHMMIARCCGEYAPRCGVCVSLFRGEYDNGGGKQCADCGARWATYNAMIRTEPIR